jgi:RNA polymerase sigma-70 factor (ECF subfamily)
MGAMTVAETSAPSWERLRAELVRFVASRVRDAAAADDIVHDVLLRAFDQLAGPQPPVQLKAWLYRVTRNAIVDHYRARRPTAELGEDFDLAAPEAGGADDHSAERDLAGCLEPLLETLPETYRRALVLAEVDDLPQVEIARRENLSLSGAKSRVQRARRMLREAVVACCRVEIDRRGGVVDFEGRNGGPGCAGPSAAAAAPSPETNGACGCRTCRPRA